MVENSDFDKNWIKPAGVSAIPTTFIIQNNKVLWQTLTSMINDEIIELLLKKEFSIEKANKINAKGK